MKLKEKLFDEILSTVEKDVSCIIRDRIYSEIGHEKWYHMQILIDMGFAVRVSTSNNYGSYPTEGYRLTYKAHLYLEKKKKKETESRYMLHRFNQIEGKLNDE